MNLDLIVSQYEETFGEFKNPIRREGFRWLASALLSDTRITEPAWTPYILATVKWEAADRWQPIAEFSPRNTNPRTYFNRKYSGRRDLGNRGGNDGYDFRGRGYCQITGRANYTRFNDALSLERSLVEFPDDALIREVSYEILVEGMTKGMFTGKRLGQYISGNVKNFTFARQIINRMDRAWKIATIAESFERILVTP